MRTDLATPAVVVLAIPLLANSSMAALTNRSRVTTFCSCRVTACIGRGSLTEYLLSEYILTMRDCVKRANPGFWGKSRRVREYDGRQSRYDAAVSADRVLRTRHARRWGRQSPVLGGVRQSAWQAGGRPAWWSGIGMYDVASQAVRSGRISRRAVRSAQLRTQHAACERA